MQDYNAIRKLFWNINFEKLWHVSERVSKLYVVDKCNHSLWWSFRHVEKRVLNVKRDNEAVQTHYGLQFNGTFRGHLPLQTGLSSLILNFKGLLWWCHIIIVFITAYISTWPTRLESPLFSFHLKMEIDPDSETL